MAFLGNKKFFQNAETSMFLSILMSFSIKYNRYKIYLIQTKSYRSLNRDIYHELRKKNRRAKKIRKFGNRPKVTKQTVNAGHADRPLRLIGAVNIVSHGHNERRFPHRNTLWNTLVS